MYVLGTAGRFGTAQVPGYSVMQDWRSKGTGTDDCGKDSLLLADAGAWMRIRRVWEGLGGR